MNPAIELSFKKINALEEDARYEGWSELYFSADPEADSLFRKLLKGDDEFLAGQGIKFLAEIAEKRAIELLVEALLLDRPNLFAQIKKSFQRNQFSKKVECLFHVLDNSPTESVYGFAITQIASTRHPDLLEYLRVQLPQSHESRLCIILDALRSYTDSRIEDWVNPFIEDTREEVRVRVFLVLERLLEFGDNDVRKYFMRGLSDTSPKVRKVSLWGLRQKPHKADVPYLMKMLRDDPDVSVRLEAMQESIHFPTSEVISLLLNFLFNEEKRVVVLKAESLLLSVKPHVLFKAVKRLIAHDPHFNSRACVFLATIYPESEDVFQIISNRLNMAKEDKDKIYLIEALASCRNDSTISILEKYLSQSFIVAYAAMKGILKNAGTDHVDLVCSYLERESLSPVVRQEVFHFLGNPQLVSHSRVSQLLIKNLSSPNLNERYLSLKALSKSQSHAVLSEFLKIVLKEQHHDLKAFAREYILKSPYKTIDWVVSIMRDHAHSTEDELNVLFDLLGSLAFSADDHFNWLKIVWNDDELNSVIPQKYLMSLWWALLCRGRLSFADILALHEDRMTRNARVAALLLCKPRDLTQKFEMPVALLSEWFELGENLDQELIIDLLALSDSPKAMSLLTDAYCSGNENIKRSAYRVMQLQLRMEAVS